MRNNTFSTITLLCMNTTKEKILEITDYLTLKGEIVLLSSYNILDDSNKKTDFSLEMDKEKIHMSDRLVVYGKVLLSDSYASELIEYVASIGKKIQYLSS